MCYLEEGVQTFLPIGNQLTLPVEVKQNIESIRIRVGSNIFDPLVVVELYTEDNEIHLLIKKEGEENDMIIKKVD